MKDVLRDFDADFLLFGLLPEDRARTESLTELWARRVQAFIEPLYDVDDRQGKNQVIAAVEPDLRSQAGDRRDELKSWVYDALQIFLRNCRRVDRKAIEVAQRCSLAGLEPVALVVETESSLKRRWNRFLRNTLKSHLMPRGKKKVLESERVADFQYGDVDELVGLVRKLVKQPRDSDLARSFAEETLEAGADTWSEVLDVLAQQADDDAVRSAVVDGLQICRSKAPDAASLTAKIHAVADRFEKLSQRKNPAVKTRKRTPPAE